MGRTAVPKATFLLSARYSKTLSGPILPVLHLRIPIPFQRGPPSHKCRCRCRCRKSMEELSEQYRTIGTQWVRQVDPPPLPPPALLGSTEKLKCVPAHASSEAPTSRGTAQAEIKLLRNQRRRSRTQHGRATTTQWPRFLTSWPAPSARPGGAVTNSISSIFAVVCVDPASSYLQIQ